MTRIISVLSGKGGVGKSTVTASLGAALADMGHDVLLIDGNLTTPNLSLHLGMPFYPKTLNDLLTKKAKPPEVIYQHYDGFKVIPSSLSVKELKNIDLSKLQSVLLNLLGKADIILIDGAAGLGREARTVMELSDEVILVISADMPSVTDALRAIKLAEEKGIKVSGIVVNRYRGKKHEMTLNDIKDMLEYNIISIIPEDEAVPQSIAAKRPVVKHRPYSRAAIEIRRLAQAVSSGRLSKELERPGFWERILKLFK